MMFIIKDILNQQYNYTIQIQSQAKAKVFRIQMKGMETLKAAVSALEICYPLVFPELIVDL